MLYLLGPVGGGKSSIAEKLNFNAKSTYLYLKRLTGKRPPLCLFSPHEDAELLEKEYGIPTLHKNHYVTLGHHLHEYNGDITKFKLVKRTRLF